MPSERKSLEEFLKKLKELKKEEEITKEKAEEIVKELSETEKEVVEKEEGKKEEQKEGEKRIEKKHLKTSEEKLEEKIDEIVEEISKELFSKEEKEKINKLAREKVRAFKSENRRWPNYLEIMKMAEDIYEELKRAEKERNEKNVLEVAPSKELVEKKVIKKEDDFEESEEKEKQKLSPRERFLMRIRKRKDKEEKEEGVKNNELSKEEEQKSYIGKKEEIDYDVDKSNVQHTESLTVEDLSLGKISENEEGNMLEEKLGKNSEITDIISFEQEEGEQPKDKEKSLKEGENLIKCSNCGSLVESTFGCEHCDKEFCLNCAEKVSEDDFEIVVICPNCKKKTSVSKLFLE